MKKLLLIALVAGFAFAATPRTEARTYVSVGIGFPIGFGYYGGGGYPGYYGYGYPAYYPYGHYRSYRPYHSVGYRHYSRPYYWHHGRKIYYGRRVVRR